MNANKQTKIDKIVLVIDMLEKLQDCVPVGQGSVSIRVHRNLEAGMILEMWGVDVAWCWLGEPMFVDRLSIEGCNPGWFDDVDSIVENINNILIKNPVWNSFKNEV